MCNIITKGEVEKLLGYKITDEQFNEALEYAKRKQEYIYKRKHQPGVLQGKYLTKLIEEYVRSLAFSKFTMDLCRTLRYMEKEHSALSKSTLTDNHIVAVTALKIK